MTFIDNNVLEMALIGYEAERKKIEAAITDIRSRLNGASGSPAASAPKKRSAAARKRMAMAQQRRWAAQRQGKEEVRPKRKLSAAGRRAIVEATKERWAAFHRAAKKAAA